MKINKRILRLISLTVTISVGLASMVVFVNSQIGLETKVSAQSSVLSQAVSMLSTPNCNNPITVPKEYSSKYPQLPAILSCLHKKYCVVQGAVPIDSGHESLGYNEKLSRSQYVAFITRYHVNVLKDDWKPAFDKIQDHYNTLPKKFYDVSADPKNPNYHTLWKEIYTAQKMGFIQGYEDNTFKPEGLWRYEFHGITRTDSYKGSPYNFSRLGTILTRGEFLTQLYDYGTNQTKQLTTCIAGTTPAHPNFPSRAPIKPSISTVIATPTPTQKFSDVSPNEIGYTEINKLVTRKTSAPDNSSITGCTATQFCPNSRISRVEFSKFMIVGMKQSVSGAASIFSDLTSSGAYKDYIKYVMRMKELQITQGCTTTTFCPADSITRSTLLTFIARGFSTFSTYIPPTTPSFIDVPKTHANYKAVEFAKSKGIATGCDTTRFCPDTVATRREAAIFLMRAWPN